MFRLALAAAGSRAAALCFGSLAMAFKNFVAPPAPKKWLIYRSVDDACRPMPFSNCPFCLDVKYAATSSAFLGSKRSCRL